LSEGIIGRVARTGVVALVPDVSLDQDYLPTYPDTIAELVVPIFHGSVVVGVINIETNNPDQLTAQDRDLVEVLAGQISIALENAVLYEHLREHAQDLEHIVTERTSELVALYELSQKIGNTLTNGELLQMLLSHLRSAARSDVVVGGLFQGAQHLLFIETSRPISPASMNQLHSYWLEMIKQHDLSISDLEDIPIEVISREASPSSGVPLGNIASLIHAPILISGEVVGILIAGCEEENAFGEAEARILDTFANQATAGLQRLAALLAAEQKRLEGLVEHLPVGILLLDSEYRLLMSNPLGREILSILNPDYTTGQLTHLGKADIGDLITHQNDPLPVEISLPGPQRRVFVTQAGLAGEDSHHWLLTLREVTQERENQARIQMQERLATVGQLAAGIAHDFNNIMAAILVYTDLLAEDPDIPGSSRDRLQIIKQQVQRAASLIRQILDFSRRSVMEQSDLDVLPFIKELDKMLRRVLPETIQLELSYRAGNYLVHADPTRLQQAFMNLALNARDAMPNGGLLRYELDHLLIEPGQRPPMREMGAGEWVRISVKDSGAGIRTDHLPHIFEPFFTTKPVGQGTGLGLAQVYGIIKQHDGFIDVKSQVGHGTMFTIYLPAISEPQMDEQVNEPRVQINGIGKKVLVVEDDRATREALQALLEAHNYGVLTAWNGLDALKYLADNPAQIDLVVSDVVMPQMGGVALYKIIQERWPEIKVLLVTGHPMEDTNQEMLEQGGINWLQKPFSAQTFNQTVFSLLQE
jgi:signal transduction histidine kinase